MYWLTKEVEMMKKLLVVSVAVCTALGSVAAAAEKQRVTLDVSGAV